MEAAHQPVFACEYIREEPMKIKLFTLLLALGASGSGHAAPISITNDNVGGHGFVYFEYTQDFDTLASSTPLGSTTPWANDSTLSGWSLFNKDNAAISSYIANAGSSSNGSFYSFGISGSSDRALGSVAAGTAYFGAPANGAPAGYMALAVTNQSSANIGGFDLRYDGEQWRSAATVAQSLTVQYGFGETFASVSTWTDAGAAFNFTSPVNAGSRPLNGNVASNRVEGVSGSVAFTDWSTGRYVVWQPGQTLWVRWTDLNDVGNDHGLAIDNVVFTVVVPEPTSYALALAGLAVAGLLARRRKAA